MASLEKNRRRAEPDPRAAQRAGAYESALSLMRVRAEVFENRTAFYSEGDGGAARLTYSELAASVRKLSDYLIERGFGAGARVAILSESRPEWAVAFFAAVRSGVVVVPLDSKLSVAELLPIVADAEPRLLFVSSRLAASAGALRARLSSLEEIVVMDGEGAHGPYPLLSELEARRAQEGAARSMDETALIVYTSGTTAGPKGVMITFKNLGHQITNLEHVMKLSSEDVLLSILPMNHLLELTCGFLGVLYSGGAICYSNTLFPHELAQIMRERKVTGMICVPLFLRMLKSSIEKEIGRLDKAPRAAFEIAFKAARRIPFRFARKLLFRRVHKQLGGRFRCFISGGAPLDPKVFEFFDRLGLPVYQGYGLTETSPVIAVNTPRNHRFNSVGKPLAGVRVRISAAGGRGGEGEVLTAGPHVMKGYYRRDDLTRQVIDEKGWLHTGDLGRLDEDGFLYITGRLKNLIVLGSGKKVSPEEVEAALSGSPLIKEVCVIGLTAREGSRGGAESVCAVVVPGEQVARRHASEDELFEEVREEVNRLSLGLAPFKRPSKVIVSLDSLPKTPSLKVKRAEVLELLARRGAGRESGASFISR
ncbi:MAG TPA: AMP-binding protein [Blastocatellia bacterium]|nr:AMP-binding protein [Blastocatellia bacterium]